MMDGLPPVPDRFAPPAPQAAGQGLRKVMMLVTELEDYTIAFANGVARHLPVVLAVPERQYGRLREWFDPGVDLRLLDWPRHRSLSNPRFLWDLQRLVRRERPDVIHLLSNNVLWLNLIAPLWRHIPLVTTVHDVTTHPGDRETATLPGWSSRLMARQSAHLVVHGEGLRQAACARLGVAPERVHVLSHPALPRYARLARRDGLTRRAGGGFTALLFGRIYAYKGLDLLLRAGALLPPGDGTRIVIAGRGDDPLTLRDRMGDPARYDIRHRFIPDAEVAQLFLDADAVVLPYAEASQSGVLHLACAFGRPVIVTDVGELGATVRAHDIGLVVAPGDAAALARAMERLARDDGLRDRLGRNARLWAEGANAPEAVGAAAARLYRSILGGRDAA